MHLAILPIGLYLIAITFLLAPLPPSPASQNHVVVGILLLMLAILPSHNNQIPRSWQRFYEAKK
jgi:hypothetical protein